VGSWWRERRRICWWVSKVPEERQLAAWLTDKALDFLGNIEGEEDPFFLYLSFSFPHAPALIPPGYEDFYDIENTEIEIPEFPMDAVLDEHSKPWEGLESWKSKTPKEREDSCTPLLHYLSFSG
jgi:hypothetical protein